MGYEIEIVPEASAELKGFRAHDRVRILDEVEEQLAYQPQVGTRNRKMLDVEVAGFDFNPPLWELRIGKFRVFYDVDEVEQLVVVRVVRSKQKGQTTEDILR